MPKLPSKKSINLGYEDIANYSSNKRKKMNNMLLERILNTEQQKV